MRCLFKGLFRTTVIGAALLAAVAGGAAMLVGPERVEAAVEQVTGRLEHLIDDRIQDPVALRQKLATLERRYPERIRQVRNDMNELTLEIARLEREKAVSERVVELVDVDVAALTPLIEEARSGRAALAAVQFEDEVMSLPTAKTKLDTIQRARVVHTARAEDAGHSLKYLRQQESRFAELLSQLETEHLQLTSQLQQLEREVDSIARNERLIELLEKRQNTLERASRYEAVSLGEITGELARIRAEQEARLDLLAASRNVTDYEERAATLLSLESASGNAMPACTER